MQVNVQKLSPVLVEIQVEVPADHVKNEVDKAFTALQKTAKVRGFRPGKAPRDVLTHLYGEGLLLEVARRIVDTTLSQAIADQKVQAVSQPAIEPQKLSKDKTFSYKARVEVRPDVGKVTYEGFSVKRPAVKLAAKMVDEELERLRREHSTLAEPSPARPARKGDVLTISFGVEMDGKPVKDAAADDVPVELGAGQFLPEIDAALDGAQAGLDRSVELTFPASHPRPGFRGKKASFHIKVKQIKERVLPALDDEFAKDVGAFESLSKLKEDVKDNLEKALKQKAEDAVAEQLVAQLCEKNPIPCPPSLVEQQCRLMEQELVEQARRQGQKMPITEELHARVHADSEMKVRAGLLMAEIAKTAKIQVTKEDIEKGYAELAEQSGKEVAKVKADHKDQRKQEMLVGMILEDKILDMIEQKAKITEA